MLTPAWFPLRYHPAQTRVWRTKARFVALACGRGSGKTELSRRRLVRFLPVKKPWPDPIYFLAYPTRAQAKLVAWERIKALIPKEWIASPDDIRESDLTIKTRFGSKLFLVGMNEPARIEGVQWDGGVIDESCDQWPGSFARFARRYLIKLAGVGVSVFPSGLDQVPPSSRSAGRTTVLESLARDTRAIPGQALTS